MERKNRRILVMKDGREIPVTGITGRHYVTREKQYRKNDPMIRSIRAAANEECDALTDAMAAKEKRKRNRGQ